MYEWKLASLESSTACSSVWTAVCSSRLVEQSLQKVFARALLLLGGCAARQPAWQGAQRTVQHGLLLVCKGEVNMSQQ